jgi:hypothetical protein
MMAEHRHVADSRISPLYAQIGPSAAHALRAADGDERKARRILREWEAWRAEYGELWDAGVVGTPEPPHHLTAGSGFARPA